MGIETRREQMSAIAPLPSLIRASAHDAASMSMRAAGRTKWNDDDWNAMCETQERLIRACYGRESDHNQPNMCYIRFSVAEALQNQGVFTLKSKPAEIMKMIDEALA